ncbi:CesT family type III secretion system chaperone [Limnobacter sp.]|uniref:CesT family type III secretion system chaperone n=1 Tax=Limnobacter sp. TaxID=2003368 RepID=UPI002FE0D467
MSKDNFYKLIMDYSALTGLTQPGKVIDGAPVCVDDVLFSFVYDQESNPDEIYICGDLGPLSEKLQEEDQRALLSANLDFYVDYNVCFGLSPVNGHAVICLRSRLGALTPKDLRDQLETAACIAKAWNISADGGGYWQDKPPAPPHR